jgi:hypothetical protein
MGNVTATGGDPTTEEVLEFVAANTHVYLLGRRSDGYPTVWAMTARAVDGGVEFSTYRASAKVRHLLREATATVLVPAGDPDDHRVLITSGRVALGDARAWGSSGPAGTGSPPSVVRLVPEGVAEKVQSRHDSGKRVVLRLSIDEARFSAKVPPR